MVQAEGFEENLSQCTLSTTNSTLERFRHFSATSKRTLGITQPSFKGYGVALSRGKVYRTVNLVFNFHQVLRLQSDETSDSHA